MNRARRSTHPARGAQAGVGLIEVLIALLVLSFGMLGLAGLQMRTLRDNQSSMQRGMAVVQMHSIADMMRADRANALGHNFDIALDATAPTGSTFAARALTEWRANLQVALGTTATGQVECDGSECTIVVRWNDERATRGSDVQTITTVVQL